VSLVVFVSEADSVLHRKRSGDLFVPVFALTAIIGYSLIIAYDFFRTADLGGFEWIGK